MSQPEEVILVDTDNNVIGYMEKMKAHKQKILHRAFSLFLINDKNEILLQKRASTKYHSPNLWTNTCCSHPRKNEKLENAVSRRTFEELGINIANHKNIFDFVYEAKLEFDLWENEFDHVFICKQNLLKIPFSEEEISEVRWMKLDDIISDRNTNESIYTSWFKIILDKHYLKLKNAIENY